MLLYLACFWDVDKIRCTFHRPSSPTRYFHSLLIPHLASGLEDAV